MSIHTILKPPHGLNEVPDETVWIHSPILCKEHHGILGTAVYTSEDLAKSVFPDWTDSEVQKVFTIEEISFEEVREIAKTSLDLDGNQVVAIHLHSSCLDTPTLTHWVL